MHLIALQGKAVLFKSRCAKEKSHPFGWGEMGAAKFVDESAHTSYGCSRRLMDFPTA
jgi:hypothetical protein